jgi:hypothetical protein
LAFRLLADFVSSHVCNFYNFLCEFRIHKEFLGIAISPAGAMMRRVFRAEADVERISFGHFLCLKSLPIALGFGVTVGGRMHV